MTEVLGAIGLFAVCWMVLDFFIRASLEEIQIQIDQEREWRRLSLYRIRVRDAIASGDVDLAEVIVKEAKREFGS